MKLLIRVLILEIMVLPPLARYVKVTHLALTGAVKAERSDVCQSVRFPQLEFRCLLLRVELARFRSLSDKL